MKNIWRAMVAALALAAILVASAALSSCFWASAPISPTAAPSPSPLPPTSTPTLAPSRVSQSEAQTTVKAWFAAILAQDYATASGLTSGAATDRTRELAEGFQAAIGGNAVELTEDRVELTPAPPPSQDSQAVQAKFDIDVNARVGPIMVPVHQIAGEATFVVGRVDGRTRITEIGNVTGLPITQ